ncbi:MAG: S41 family peptidase [Treponema sp.]|nr:S41 family peptidase [Treponema sp.]
MTLLMSFVFIVSSVPQLDAQNIDQEARRYSGIMQNVFNFVQQHYVDEIDPKVLYEGALNGMFEALGDPHSTYLEGMDMTDLNDTTEGNFGGVGLLITKAVEARPDGKPLWVEVASPIEDTPGWKAGINPGDFITAINGEDTAPLTMDEVLERLRGEEGTEVTLQIRRGERLDFPVVLERAIIEVPSVKQAMIGKTGYLRITTFTPMTAARAQDALDYFKTQNYDSLIIDLRYNYGGLLNSAIDISDLFLEGGVVVSTKSRIASENRTFTARRSTEVPADMPIIVLINVGSASASEIVAGALKDRNRAYLVGEKSYGKGSVQQLFNLDRNDSSGFKLTTARYYTPSDVNIDKIGIPPDREVLLPTITDDEAIVLNQLINDNKIPTFVEENPNATKAQTAAFIESLSSEYKIDQSWLKQLMRNEQNRTVTAPVYDLEYDIQLQEAVKILESGDYPELMKNAKTLKQLQDEASQEDAETETEDDAA